MAMAMLVDPIARRNMVYRLNPRQNQNKKGVCTFWAAGFCKYGHSCRFRHSLRSPPSSDAAAVHPHPRPHPHKKHIETQDSPNQVWLPGNRKNAPECNFLRPVDSSQACRFWLAGNCKFGEHCKYLHSHSNGAAVNFVAHLNGHQKVCPPMPAFNSTYMHMHLSILVGFEQAIRGIVYPTNSQKLYTGGQDKSVRVWDCHTGECVNVIQIGHEIGCMLGEGPWIFAGLPNEVKAWNIETLSEQSLSGPVGQVHSLAIAHDMLVAGVEDGNILAWKFNQMTKCFEPAKLFSGHSKAVVTLLSAEGRLYSGSMDHTIKVWDLASGQCIQTLEAHSDIVTSLLCWKEFLLSCSLDGTIKVWVASTTGSDLEVTYSHAAGQGVLSLCGVHDGECEPVLICAFEDCSVRLYELPSFNERMKLFSSKEVSSLQIGQGGLIFTGDQNGQLKVWKWAAS